MSAPARIFRLGDERGVALAVAVFALVVIGALVGAHFFPGRLEQQSGRNTLYAGQAREAAEAGLSDALATMDTVALVALPAGGAPLTLGSFALGNGVSATRDVSRLTANLVLVRSHGVRLGGGGIVLAVRSVGVLLHQVPSAALPDTATGSVQAVMLGAERGWIQLY